MRSARRMTVWGFLLLTFSASPAFAQDQDVAPADEEAIREACEKYIEAYNRRDSKTMASMWSPDAIYMDPTTGEEIVGRDAIAKHFDYIFAGSEDAKLDVTIDSIDFASPNVAIEKGTDVVTYSDFEPQKSAYAAVHVRRDGQWLLDRVSEEPVPEPPLSNYKHLKELEWLVGSWVDSDEAATIQSKVEWTKNQNFLRRSFAVVTRDGVSHSGIQVIGWDPAEKTIRSWVFDSDGGFAEGAWKREADQWLIQKSGTLTDGSKTTSLNIMTYVDDNTFQWESVNRTVDGELQPNIAPVTVVRAPAGGSEEAPQ